MSVTSKLKTILTVSCNNCGYSEEETYVDDLFPDGSHGESLYKDYLMDMILCDGWIAETDSTNEYVIDFKCPKCLGFKG